MKKRSVDIRENDGVHTRILAKLGLIVNMLVLVFLLASCSQRFVSDSRIALGTAVYIRVAGDEDVLSGAFDVIYDADRAISRFTEGSWIWEINENAGIQPVAVPDDIYTLIKRSFDMAYATNGVFNPMIGPLSSLWGMGTEDARVPDDEEIMAVLPLLDYRKAALDDNARTVYLPEKGMSLDLGAVGKGWASDLVRDYLSSEGVESALINLGGNIVVMGDNNGKPWKIGIQRPGAESGSYFMLIEAEDTAIVTSGGYQRYIEEDGVIYHHILSSETGYPAETDIISATVISPDGTLADMLSTTIFASGSDSVYDLARAYGVRAIVLTDNLSVIDTDSAEGEVAILEE